MFPKTIHEAARTIFWLALSFLTLAWVTDEVVSMLGVIWLSFLVMISAAVLMHYGARERLPLDIWVPQRTLMKASGQQIPMSPSVTNASVLYMALTLEELAETMQVQLRVLNYMNRHTAKMGASSGARTLANLAGTLGATMMTMDSFSKAIRKELELVGPFNLDMLPADAVSLLDGVSDMTVTLAGLGLASGLPVREGYQEVQSSNLSKRNPNTLVIDKTPDGKWIKGSAYRPPNLSKVLQKALGLDDYWRSH